MRNKNALSAILITIILLMTQMAVAKDAPAKPDPKDQMPPTIAAVVDMQRVLQESRAAKSAQRQLDSQRARYQTETEKEENQLSSAEQELTHTRDHLTGDVYAEREQQLRQRFLSVERNVSSRRHALDQAYTAAMNEVKNVLLDIVQTTARAHGVNMVIVKQQVFWSEKPLDITDEVLQKLDKKLPQVSVNFSSDAP